ncbi:hypothetical protein PPYR_14401 [Photinus pyralis]|uniref:Protein-lysine N-methyltransferase SMYD4 n=1 Tax=Photinus pyralis TaxID=7054 RepID=A0A5N4A558_PHOPY|nr:hypothetical protein PPYR_14401 [Photinus pyralis]
MDGLFEKYTGITIKGAEDNVAEIFSQFYAIDQHAKLWLRTLLQSSQLKDDTKSIALRLEGNKYYAEKNFRKAFRCYTKALCFARNDLGFITANRSALFYMTGHYEDCLSDIAFAFKHDLPDHIKLKLLIRRIKCLAILHLDVKNAVDEAVDFTSTREDKVKEEILKASLSKGSTEPKPAAKVPSLKDAEINCNFLSASSAVSLRYDEIRGRHVVANKRLKPGDILFVEKPFVFAPVFNDDKELSLTRCYNCLKLIYSSIPCQTCVVCVFCNEECRESSWQEFHQWECCGMRADLWYHLGIGFPAVRALFKGLPHGLRALSSSYEDTAKFGDPFDNYPYFDKLISNLSKMDNILPLIVTACVIVLYLEDYTGYLKGMSKQTEFVCSLGGRLVKHMAQLQCNSSLICTKLNTDKFFASEDSSLACGIYPSVSMMNHSCKSNITIDYFDQVLVAKAAEEVYPGEEISNCYGIDYRYADKETRQEHCNQLYFFTCNCRICKHPELELPL